MNLFSTAGLFKMTAKCNLSKRKEGSAGIRKKKIVSGMFRNVFATSLSLCRIWLTKDFSNSLELTVTVYTLPKTFYI